ncbi:hypothetical protein ACIN5099_1123 [Acinetobacter baumannii OIFC099]|nr:hypothetical protein ACIN5099_1123 [Acinetobacter baumannii OIFC099]
MSDAFPAPLPPTQINTFVIILLRILIRNQQLLEATCIQPIQACFCNETSHIALHHQCRPMIRPNQPTPPGA